MYNRLVYTDSKRRRSKSHKKTVIEISALKRIGSVKKENILTLARFLKINNDFYLDGLYYKQIRVSAMGLPLTLRVASAFMYFVEKPI